MTATLDAGGPVVLPVGSGALVPGRVAGAGGPGDGRDTVIEASALRGAAGVRPLMGYQVDAVPAIVDGLRQGGRGQFLAACGTGKTMVGLHAALRLCPAGVVVLTCPTLPLLAQTLTLWASVTEHVLAVCSDQGVAVKARRYGVTCPVTTSAARVLTWLLEQPTGRLRVVLVTHLSAGVAGAGLLAAGLAADLLLVDEAHHTAGLVGKRSALVHDDNRLPARRRLYMTATARVRGPRQDPGTAMSMDDDRLYGPVLFHYPFADAIADGWLDDFQVAAIGITRREVLHLLDKAGPDAVVQAGEAPLHTMVVQAALVRAAATFGLRRILVFNRTIAESREFARTLARTVEVLAPAERPDGLLTVRHVEGTQPVATRSAALDLLDQPPAGGWTVVSNPRCLGEGLDVTGIDAVAYAHPPGSMIGAVQGVSRALRRNPHGSGVATILVPMLLPDDGGADLTDAGAWQTLLRTLWALRAHDERFAASLDMQRARSVHGRQVQLPEQVRILLPEGYHTPDILDHVAVRIVEHAGTTWTAGIDALTAFHADHGHTLVPPGYHAGRLDLHRWLRRETALLDAGQQPAGRVTLLEKLGVTATTSAAPPAAPPTVVEQAARQLDAVRTHHAEHRHLRTLPATVIDGVDVHQWLAEQRQPGSLARTDRALGQILDALDPGWGIEHEPACVEALHAIHTYHRRHGDLRPAPDTVIGGVDVHQWLGRYRQPAHCTQHDQALREMLTALDARWVRAPYGYHDDALRAVRGYHAQHGHPWWPPGTVINDTNLDPLPERLHKWFRDGSLSSGQTAAWETLGVDRHYRRNLTFARGAAAARRYLDREGHLDPPRRHRENGVDLRWWIGCERANARLGHHTADQTRRLRELGISKHRPPNPVAPPAPRPAPAAQGDGSIDAARAFHRRHGHLFPTPDDVVDGINLYAALRQIRYRHVTGRLTTEQKAAWNALGIVWNRKQVFFAWGITACRRYRAREGHLNPPHGHQEIGLPLDSWIRRQRHRAAAGSLSGTELDQLIDIAPELLTRPGTPTRPNPAPSGATTTTGPEPELPTAADPGVHA